MCSLIHTLSPAQSKDGVGFLEEQGITPPTKRHKGGQDKSIATDWLNVPGSELDKTEKSTTLIPVKTGY